MHTKQLARRFWANMKNQNSGKGEKVCWKDEGFGSREGEFGQAEKRGGWF